MDDIPEKIDNILNEIPYMILGVQGKNIDHNDGFALCGRLRFAILNEMEEMEKQNKENNAIIADLVRQREELKQQIDKLKRIQRVRNSLD